MSKASAIGIVALAATLAAGNAAAQPPAGPYTFVAEWKVPRAQWTTFVADFDKNTRPVLEKLAAAGTLVGWGAYESIVHTDEGYTHGTWWSSPTAAGIEQARLALIKASASSTALNAATGHRDFYLRSIVIGGKTASGTDGYLRVSSQLVKPGQGQAFRQAWEKNTKPVLDDLLAQGSLVGYSLDVEDTHTDNPGIRMMVTVTPNIEADDKVGAAFDAAGAKRTPDERKALQAAFEANVEGAAHRDLFARVIRYWQK